MEGVCSREWWQLCACGDLWPRHGVHGPLSETQDSWCARNRQVPGESDAHAPVQDKRYLRWKEGCGRRYGTGKNWGFFSNHICSIAFDNFCRDISAHPIDNFLLMIDDVLSKRLDVPFSAGGMMSRVVFWQGISHQRSKLWSKLRKLRDLWVFLSPTTCVIFNDLLSSF